MPTLKIKRMEAGNVTGYLLVGGKDAVLVDTGREKYRDKVLGACLDYNVRLIVLTHGHVDHVQNAAYLARWLQAPIAMHEADLDLLPDNCMQPLTAETPVGKAVLALSVKSFREDVIPEFHPSVFLKEGDTLERWGIPARAVELPGHTRGSIGLDIAEKHLLVGDALMNMLYPTASLLYNDRVEMLASARKIAGMGERTIWFGHGKPAANRDWV